MSKAVVTGGAGFIGSHIVDRLLKEGYDVTVLDNFITGDRKNLKHVENDIELIEGDILDHPTVERAVAGAEVVFHEAALGSVSRSIEDPQRTNSVNVDGTLNVLVASRDAGVSRLMYASSSSVYGDTPTLPKHEEMPVGPISPYGVSKLTAEMYCRVFARVYDIKTYSLRYFNVFGARQTPDSIYAAVIPKFATSLLAGTPPTVFGDGGQTRDFTYIDNVVDANMLAMRATEGSGQAFNVATGGRVSLNDLLKAISGVTGTEVPAIYKETRAGDIRDSYADVLKAGNLLDYTPGVSVEEGLKRTVEWYRTMELADVSA